MNEYTPIDHCNLHENAFKTIDIVLQISQFCLTDIVIKEKDFIILTYIIFIVTTLLLRTCKFK